MQVATVIRSTARKARSGFYSYLPTPGLQDGNWNPQMGYGVVNAAAALNAASSIIYFNNQTVTSNTPLSGTEIFASNVSINNNATLSMNASKIISMNNINVTYGTITAQAPLITFQQSFSIPYGSKLVLSN